MNEPGSTADPERGGAGPAHLPAIGLQCILAPVDFSPASRYGLAFAGALAERFHSRVHLLHVVEPPVLPEWGYAHLARRDVKLRRAAEKRLPQFPSECGVDPGLIQSTEVRAGEAENAICNAATERLADVIVLASHGLGGVRHAVFGSTAERVARRAPCPVLTVRERAVRNEPAAAVFDLKRILVATDLSDESKKAFPYAAALARKFEASLILLYVVPAAVPAELAHLGIVLEEERLLEEARERLPRFRQAELDPHLCVDLAVLIGGPAREICDTAGKRGADLIVMATHGNTGLKHFMLGSVTENVIRHAPCPVLVVRERERDFVRA